MEQETPKRRWITRTLKIIFCIAAALLILFTVMANIGGSSPALKQSIEEFIAESTGFDANIETLHNMTFFPDISFDFENTEFYLKNEIDPVMYAHRVQVAFGFWDVMASTGRIKTLKIEGFKALPGMVLDTDLEVDKIQIVEDEAGARLESSGKLGIHPFTVTSNMTSAGLGQRKQFNFGDERDFVMTLGDVTLHGKMKGGDNGEVIFENLELKTGGKPVLTGRLEVTRGELVVRADGELRMADKGTDLAPRLKLHIRERGGIYRSDGEIASTEFQVEDFGDESAYAAAMKTIESAFSADAPVTPESVNYTLRAGTLYRSGVPQGAYDGPLPLRGWRIDAAALKPAQQ